MQKDPLLYIRHILDCISKIKKFTVNLTRETFVENDLIQDAVLRNLEVLGEATKIFLLKSDHVSRKFRGRRCQAFEIS